MMNFIDNNAIHDAGVDAAAGTSRVNGDSIDTANAECITFTATFGTIANNAVTALVVQTSDTGSGAWADVARTTVPASADNDTYVIELVKPLKRYARACITRGTANATVKSGLAILSYARKKPAPHGSTVSAEKTIDG